VAGAVGAALEVDRAWAETDHHRALEQLPTPRRRNRPTGRLRANCCQPRAVAIRTRPRRPTLTASIGALG
jgi:hypothetical protein